MSSPVYMVYQCQCYDHLHHLLVEVTHCPLVVLSSAYFIAFFSFHKPESLGVGVHHYTHFFLSDGQYFLMEHVIETQGGNVLFVILLDYINAQC